jgi:hypothetical protein
MSPRARKVALTGHIISSVGWMGAVGCFLALAIVGIATGNAAYMRAAYLSMKVTGWWVVMPLSLLSSLTGVVQALGTPWGMFKHYWVSIKFWLSVIAASVLLLHLDPTNRLAALAVQAPEALESSREIRYQLLADAGAALLVLALITVLAVFKPRGLTRYGHRHRIASPNGEGFGQQPN